jgi:RNA polymerase sigma-70 factor (ECF subfamily)
MNSHRDSSNLRFGQTRWSLVIGDNSQRPLDRIEALNELCLGYWFPVFAFLRRCGHSPEIAQDIARAFEMHMIRSSREGLAPAAGERFRDFLLNRLTAFLAGDWRQLAPTDEFPDTPDTAELEARMQFEELHSCTPEEAYQRCFAGEIIARAFLRLRAEAQANGHLDMYEAMLPFVTTEPDGDTFAELAERLGNRPLTLVVALKRLRQRFRELVGEELADTVGTLDGLVEEQKTLHDALRRIH